MPMIPATVTTVPTSSHPEPGTVSGMWAYRAKRLHKHKMRQHTLYRHGLVGDSGPPVPGNSG